MDLVAQRLDVLGVCRQIVHDVREQIRGGVDSRHRKSDLTASPVKGLVVRRGKLLKPVQRIGMGSWRVVQRQFAVADHLSFLDLAVDDGSGRGQMPTELLHRWQEPVYEWAQDRWPHTQLTGRREGVDGIVDRDIDPILVTADLVAHEDER